MPAFYTNKLPPSTNLPNECFTDSVDITIKGIERNKYNHPTGNENTRAACLHELCKSYRLGMCQDCRATLSPERVATEEQEAKRVKDEDLLSVGKEVSKNNVDHVKERKDARAANGEYILDPAREMHAERLLGLGIRISALIAFAYAHNCWDWTTADVVRDIIKPVTREHNRCRYGDIPEMKACFGRATVFMSHCWGATFGDLIGAACHGARKDRVVWIDIFAVRQWPGNVADLDFRGVLGKCGAVVVSTSPVDGLKRRLGYMYQPVCLTIKRRLDRDDHVVFLASDEGQTAKKTLPFFRLWCIVELTAAIILNVPIVVKGGSVTSSHGIYEYDTKCIGTLMSNLMNMIDVNASECAVQADYDREMAIVRQLQGGSKGVNALVVGVVNGARSSIDSNILEIDAFVCNEPESLRALNIPLGCEGEARELAEYVLRAACFGGRESVVQELLTKWSVKEDDDQNKEGETKKNDSMKKDKEKKRKWLIQLIDDSWVLGNASNWGHAGLVERLLEVVGINVKCGALDAASRNGHTKVVKALLASKDINVNKASSLGSTPLDIATKKNHKEIIQLLKDAGAQHSLYYASENGYTEVVKALLAAKDIDVNKWDERNCTPLSIATKNNHTEIIQLLKDAGGQLYLLHVASKNGNTEVVKALLAAKNVNVNDGNPLREASRNGHTKVVKALLAAKDINVNQANWDGKTPLDIATKKNHKEIIQLLKDAGAQHSLYYASENGDVELVKALLAAKDIDVNQKGWDGRFNTPLDIATKNNHTEIIQLLTNAGASLSRPSPPYSSCPLM